MRIMAECQICTKKSVAGRSVSHSGRRSLRRFKANVQKVTFYQNGVKRTMNLCTKCLKRIKKGEGFAKQKKKE